jgi:hypothetical protein
MCRRRSAARRGRSKRQSPKPSGQRRPKSVAKRTRYKRSGFENVRFPDVIEATSIAEALLQEKPEQGYLTVSNALQWRLQYGRVIQQAGVVEGISQIT